MSNHLPWQFMSEAWNYDLHRKPLNNNHPLFLLLRNFCGNNNDGNKIGVAWQYQQQHTDTMKKDDDNNEEQ
eukprot:10197999-Ditylum_brightwellii.AAC.1